MKNIINPFKLLVLFIFIGSLAACSHKIYRDDAIRIKPNAAGKYNIHPLTGNLRNGNALRGEVKKIQFVAEPDSCPINENTQYAIKGYIHFIDSSVSKKKYVEKIPLEDADLVGLKITMEKNELNNINYFETYNSPFLPMELREVPVDTIYSNPCDEPCNCEPVNVPCLLCLDCPERVLSRWFLELKPGYSIYNDFNSLGKIAGKDDWLADVAAGLRFGKTKRWGLGIIVSSGVESFNQFDSSFAKRPSANIYARYELIREKKRIVTTLQQDTTIVEQMFITDTIRTKSVVCCDEDSSFVITRINPNYIIKSKNLENVEEYEVRPCISPFVYGLLGVSVDKLSIDLMKLNLNKDCKLQVPDVDVSLPINFGFGVGVEIPLTKYMDFSTDLGFRSISFANRTVSNGLLTPYRVRTNSLVFRIGVTF